MPHDDDAWERRMEERFDLYHDEGLIGPGKFTRPHNPDQVNPPSFCDECIHWGERGEADNLRKCGITGAYTLAENWCDLGKQKRRV